MDAQGLIFIIQAVTEIITGHFNKTGEILTDAQVQQMFTDEVQAGQSAIARRFAELGLPVPE